MAPEQAIGKPSRPPLKLSHTIRGPPGGTTELWKRDSTVPAASGVAGVILVIDAMQAQVSSFLTDVIEGRIEADGKQ